MGYNHWCWNYFLSGGILLWAKKLLFPCVQQCHRSKYGDTVCLFLRIYTTWILSVFIFVSVPGPCVFPRKRPCLLCTRQLSHVYKNRAEQEGRGSRSKVCNARCERSVVYINMSIFYETGTNVQLLNVKEEQKLQSYYASIDSIPIPMLGTILSILRSICPPLLN